MPKKVTLGSNEYKHRKMESVYVATVVRSLQRRPIAFQLWLREKIDFMALSNLEVVLPSHDRATHILRLNEDDFALCVFCGPQRK